MRGVLRESSWLSESSRLLHSIAHCQAGDYSAFHSRMYTMKRPRESYLCRNNRAGALCCISDRFECESRGPIGRQRGGSVEPVGPARGRLGELLQEAQRLREGARAQGRHPEPLPRSRVAALVRSSRLAGQEAVRRVHQGHLGVRKGLSSFLSYLSAPNALVHALVLKNTKRAHELQSACSLSKFVYHVQSADKLGYLIHFDLTRVLL